MTRDSFIFYRSYYEAIEGLAIKQQHELYKDLIDFCLNGKEPDVPGRAFALRLILEQSGHLEEYQ